MYVLLDDRKTEALLPFSEQVPRENYRINDRIRVYVLDVRKTNKGPLVVLSRAAEGLVQRLIEFQVPEIQDDIVEIMAIAREPGARTKVAVTSKRPEIDAVGACLGPKSSRVANVSDELRGEKIDVIRWAADLPSFVANALAPAKVLGVELFEEEGVALVTVPDHQLSLAIGREGQNVRLAARLTGWRLDITSDSEAAEARERYLAEREARAVAGGVEETEVEADEVLAEGEEADEEAIDQDELLRRLEEFKREMFTNE
jgi:N utilization substance protein A